MKVYDFHIPETHNFFANGFINHNTFLAVYILKEAIKKGYKNVRFTCLSDIVSLFTAAWYSSDEQKEFYNRMMDTQFLVIDDVGKEYKSKSNLSESVFDRVLRYREHPTIITSNKALEDIETTYGESITSLMYGKLISVRFAGSDFRKEEISKRLKEVGKIKKYLELIK
jgi:DNA replication protein DnaC